MSEVWMGPQKSVACNAGLLGLYFLICESTAAHLSTPFAAESAEYKAIFESLVQSVTSSVISVTSKCREGN